MPNILVGLLNAVQVIEILWFKNLNSWSLLLTMRQGTQHSKNVVLNQKYIYEIPIGSREKAKVPCTGQPTSVRSIYSWSRANSHKLHLTCVTAANRCSAINWKTLYFFYRNSLPQRHVSNPARVNNPLRIKFLKGQQISVYEPIM